MTWEPSWDEWIGKETSQEAFIDPSQVNRMAVTLDREPSFSEGDFLPPAWHWLFFNETFPASKLGEDGHPRLGLTMPEVGLPRRMWAGGSIVSTRQLMSRLRLNRQTS